MSTAAYCAPPAANATQSCSPVDTMLWLQVDRQPFKLENEDVELNSAPAKGKAKNKRALPKRQTKGRGRKVSPVEQDDEEEEDAEDAEDEIASTKKSKSAASKERRRLQNRIAQRSLRVRKEEYLQELERKLQEQEEELLVLRTENLQLRQETASARQAAAATRQSTSSSSSASYPLTDSSTTANPPTLPWSQFAQPAKAPTPGSYAWPHDLASGFEAAAWQTNFLGSPLPLPTSSAHVYESSVPSSFNLTLSQPRSTWNRHSV